MQCTVDQENEHMLQVVTEVFCLQLQRGRMAPFQICGLNCVHNLLAGECVRIIMSVVCTRLHLGSWLQA